MLRRFFDRSASAEIPGTLFNKTAIHARNEMFFISYGFTDTVMGRFDALSLHVMVLCRHLGRSKHAGAKALSQELFEEYIQSLDSALRQLGIGDTSVPKRKKRLVHSFYGHAEAFEKALSQGDGGSLKTRLHERLKEKNPGIDSELIAAYLLANVENLEKSPTQHLFAGEIDWIDPAKFM